jgi:peptide chain release factor 1
LAELDHLLAAEDATRDLDRYRAMTKEHAEIGPVVSRLHDAKAEADLAGATAFARSGDEGTPPGRLPMRRRASTASPASCRRAAAEGPERRAQRLPRTPCGHRATNPALFAGSLSACTRATEAAALEGRGCVESASDLGGYKEVIARIVGGGAYSSSVPVGRPSCAARARNRSARSHPYVGVHGGGAAEADPDADITINPADLRIGVPRVGRRRAA